VQLPDVATEAGQAARSGECLLKQAPSHRGRKGLRVRFDMDACVVHEVQPYEEVYGIHPRDFVFDRNFYMLPAINHVAMDLWSAPDSDDEPPGSDLDELGDERCDVEARQTSTRETYHYAVV
jgi:hypothetical protein